MNSILKPGVAALAAVAALTMPALAEAVPLTLAKARELAAHNEQVQEADLEVDAARDTKAAAFTKFLPQISASAGAFVADRPLVRMSTTGGNLPVYNGNPATLPAATQFAYLPSNTIEAGKRGAGLGLIAMQPLFAGGRIVNGYRLAQAGIDAAEEKRAMARRDAVAQAEERYWQLLAFSDKRSTLDAYVTSLAALERQVDQSLRGGLTTRNDLLKVRLEQQKVSVERERIDRGIALAKRDLARHLGLADGIDLELTDSLAPPETLAGLAARRGGVARRPEARLLAASARAEHLQASIQRGEMLPSISVGGALLHSDISGLGANSNAIAFGMISIPLTGIWENAHTSASRDKRAQAADLHLNEAGRQFALEADRTWDDLEVALRATAVAESAVEQADVNLKDETQRFAQGVSTLSDVLDAETLRQRALNQRIEARQDYWVKRAAFLRAVGEETGNNS